MSSPSNFNFNDKVTANVIGNEAQIQHAQAQQQNAGADLAGLAGQLAELREVLGTAARTDQERESVAAVAAAQEAAGRGDEAGMRQHLGRAGKWALGIAEQLALAAVTSAIRVAIGA